VENFLLASLRWIVSFQTGGIGRRAPPLAMASSRALVRSNAQLSMVDFPALRLRRRKCIRATSTRAPSCRRKIVWSASGLFGLIALRPAEVGSTPQRVTFYEKPGPEESLVMAPCRRSTGATPSLAIRPEIASGETGARGRTAAALAAGASAPGRGISTRSPWDAGALARRTRPLKWVCALATPAMICRQRVNSRSGLPGRLPVPPGAV